MNKEQLLAEIAGQTYFDFSSGRKNHLTDLVCSFGAIAFSFVAAIVAATQHAPAYLVAAIAGFPGLFTTLQRVIDFRGRAAWYFSKAAQLKSISRSLRYENLDPTEASKQFRELEVYMEEAWGKIGKAGIPGSTGKAK